MTHTQNINSADVLNSLTTQLQASQNCKADRAMRASFVQLEELLESLVNLKTVDSKKDASKSRGNLTTEIVNRMAPLVSKYMKEDRARAHQIVDSMSSLLADYTEGDEKALTEVLGKLQPLIMNHLIQHPEDQMGVIQTFAPLMRDAGEKTFARLLTAQSGIAELFSAMNGKEGAKVSEEVTIALEKLMSVDSDATQKVITQLTPELETLNRDNRGKMQTFLDKLMPVLQMISIRNPKGAKGVAAEFLKNNLLRKLYNLPEETQERVMSSLHFALEDLSDPATENVEAVIASMTAKSGKHSEVSKGLVSVAKSYHKSGTEASPNLKNYMGMAMLLLVQFQEAITQYQSDQSELQIKMGQSMIASAQNHQNKVEAKLAKIEKEQAEAKTRSIWQTIIGVVVAVVGAAVALFTMGIGAGIAAAVIGGFMASPAFNDVVEAISKSIASDLESGYEQKYLKEGYSETQAKELAQKKAKAVGNIIAKVVMFVAVVLVSLGCTAGAAALGAEESGDVVASEVAEEVAEEGAEEGGKAGVNAATNSATKGNVYLAASQGLSELAGSNIWMDCLNTHPEWAKKHQGLVLGIDIGLELVTMAAAMGTGIKAFKAKAAQGLLNRAGHFATMGIKFMKGSFIVQSLTSASDTYMNSKQAEYLSELEDQMREIGEDTKAYDNYLANAQFTQEAQDNLNTSSTGLDKNVAKEMDTLDRSGGIVWGTANRVINS